METPFGPTWRPRFTQSRECCKKTRLAASWLGLTVLFLELVVYVPIGAVDRASFIGINFAGIR
jgi:hypothetical protein